jgi:hypothetical protein
MIRVVKILPLAIALCSLVSTTALAETFDGLANRRDIAMPFTLFSSNLSLLSPVAALHSSSSAQDLLHGPVFTEGSPFSGSLNRLLPCMDANDSLCSTWRLTRFPRQDVAPATMTTPEPGELILIGTGLIGLGGLVRKRI